MGVGHGTAVVVIPIQQINEAIRENDKVWREAPLLHRYGFTKIRVKGAIMANKSNPTAAEKAIGSFSPKLVSLTDDVLFGDVWERSALSKRDRSLATITALIVLRASEQLPFHLKKGVENGLKQEEIVELITHMAFYSGWPSAMSAITVAKKVFEEDKQ